MTIELGKRLAALGLVLFSTACGTQPITFGETDASEEEAVSEQRQAAEKGPATSSSYFLSDGSSGFVVKSLEGGVVKAPVVSVGGNLNGPAKKSLGERSIEPVQVVGLNPSSSYVDWVKASLNGQAISKDFLLSQCNFENKELSTRSFEASLFTGVSFGPYDVTEPSTTMFSTTFTPERIKRRAGSGALCKTTGASKGKSWGGQFAFALDGVDATGVTKIDEFAIKRVVSPCTGKICVPGGELVVPTLRVNIAEGHVESWLSWFDDFVVKGNDDDSNERSGEITLLSSDLKTAYLTIGLSGVGISRLTNDVSVGETAKVRVAELYVEKVTLSNK